MSRPGFWLGKIISDEKKVRKYLSFYVHHRNLYNMGEGEIAFLRRLPGFQTSAIAWLFIKELFPTASNWWMLVLPVVIIIKVLANWSLGKWLYKQKFPDVQSDWHNHVDPVARTLSKKLLNNEGITYERL